MKKVRYFDDLKIGNTVLLIRKDGLINETDLMGIVTGINKNSNRFSIKVLDFEINKEYGFNFNFSDKKIYKMEE